MDRGAWLAAVLGIAKSRTRLSDQAPRETVFHTLLELISCGQPVCTPFWGLIFLLFSGVGFCFFFFFFFFVNKCHGQNNNDTRKLK